MMILFGNQNRNSTCSKLTCNLWDNTIKHKVDVDGPIRVDQVTFARVAKTLLGPRSPTHCTDRARDQDREGSRDRCACKNSVITWGGLAIGLRNESS